MFRNDNWPHLQIEKNMGIFDSTNSHWDFTPSANSVNDALLLMGYSYHNISQGWHEGYEQYGWGLGLPATLLTAIFGDANSQGILPQLPWNPDAEAQSRQQLEDGGWRLITPEELGYHGTVDGAGTYHGEKLGYYAAEAEVVGKYDQNGSLTQIGIAFRGTTGPRETLIPDTISDALQDLQAGSEWTQYVPNAFGDLLGHVASYASSNGLDGSDVLVTGHSLGGLAVNSMAAASNEDWQGFFADSQYIGFASPVESDKVFNLGYENDPVFQVLPGNQFGLASLLPNFSPDTATPESANNIVNFNDFYASALGGSTESIINLFSWLAHDPIAYQDGFSRIINSSFYDQTYQDSTIIVGELSQPASKTTWIRDLNLGHEERSGPTFILGSDHDDLIQGNGGTDYLEGFGGNDTFRGGGGYNIIEGGSGYNTLDLDGASKDYQIAYDGTSLYTLDSQGGITVANDVQGLKAKDGSFLFIPQDVSYQVTDGGLEQDRYNGRKHVDYAQTAHGSAGNDEITLNDNDQWAFGGAGDDVIRASEHGNATIVGGAGDDQLYSGGGDNTFLFVSDFGHDQIFDFSDSDRIVVMDAEGSNDNNLVSHFDTSDNGITLTYGDNSVELVGLSMADINQDQFVVV
ncbi:hypothetical protein LMG33810_002520 [Carnimonas sp. LMG 33810]